MSDDYTRPLEKQFAPNAAGRPPPKEEWEKEQWERDADAFEQCGLDGVKYIMDERDMHIFEGWHYSEESREWLGRFDPSFKASPESTSPYGKTCYFPYHKVLRGAQRMSRAGVKPTQSYRALKAYGAQLDREAARLDFSHEL